MSEIEKTGQAEELPEKAADSNQETERIETSKPEPRSVARSAGIVSIAVMFSRVLGLAREMIFAKYFGAGFLYDAFLVGFRIPNILRDLFAEGALSAAFVKVFTDYQLKKSEAEAWQLASLIFNALAIVLSVITLVGIFIAPYLVPLLARGFSPEKAALAVTLTQIMFPFILLVALAAVAMVVLDCLPPFWALVTEQMPNVESRTVASRFRLYCGFIKALPCAACLRRRFKSAFVPAEGASACLRSARGAAA